MRTARSVDRLDRAARKRPGTRERGSRRASHEKNLRTAADARSDDRDSRRRDRAEQAGGRARSCRLSGGPGRRDHEMRMAEPQESCIGAHPRLGLR